jgi:DNA-binding transcriptional LysR family regulator
MDIKRLTHFIALAEEGRFALAAARVHLSHSAFSRSIQKLEEQLGLRLFDRGSKGAQLTPAGEVVLRRAKDLVFDSRCLQRDIELIKLGDVGEISLGAAPVPAAVIVPGLLCELREQSPRLMTRVHLGNLGQLLGQLDSQQIDFCMGDPRLMASHDRYDMVPLGKQAGGLYCRRGHPEERRGVASSETLTRYGVAMISVTPALLKSVSAASGFKATDDFPLAVECDDIGTLVHLVSHSDVLGLLPQAVAASHSQTLVRLNAHAPSPFHANVHAISLKGRTLSPSARRAIQTARAIAKAQSARVQS